MKKNDYFQQEVTYYTKGSGYSLLEQRENYASLYHSERNASLLLEVMEPVMETYETTFSMPGFVMKHTKKNSEVWYFFLQIENWHICIDLGVKKEHDVYSFTFDTSRWDEESLELDWLPYESLPLSVHEKAGNVLIWLEEWLRDQSPYRLWLITQECHVTYSIAAKNLKEKKNETN